MEGRTTAGSWLMSSGLMAGTQRTRGMSVASTFPSFACTLRASHASHVSGTRAETSAVERVRHHDSAESNRTSSSWPRKAFEVDKERFSVELARCLYSTVTYLYGPPGLGNIIRDQSHACKR